MPVSSPAHDEGRECLLAGTDDVRVTLSMED
jgi:hypothetical protein